MRNLLLLVLLSCLITTTLSGQKKKKNQVSTVVDQDQEKYYNAVKWRHIGPFRGGRSCAVTGVPGKRNLFYMGTTGGGIWRTENGGQNWDNISDGYFGGSIGAIAVSVSDPNVIYAGGGEQTLRGNASSGYGMWKSEDAGSSWKQIGLKDSRHISRIRVHPNDPDVVYCAVIGNIYKSHEERGVFKSIDGGKNWKRILFANADAGAVDLILDPNNPRIIYATTWRARRTPYDFSSGGEGSDIWKSTDAGETWTSLSKNEGMPKGTLGIAGITVSPANSNRVWAIIEADEGGVFRSDDGGKKWVKTNSERDLRQRAWYYTRIYADSQSEDVVYVMNVSYFRSKDGGKSFDRFRSPHGDHHDLWIAPENPKRMAIADDGGAQISFDGGENWSTYMNQPTAQFYRVTTDNHFPYRIYVAQQDNSTLRIPHRTSGWSIGERDWEPTAGGESAHIAVDPEDPEIVYGGSYDGFLTRKDHRNGFTRAINVWPDNPMGHGAEGMKYRFQWNFPIFFSPHDPNKLYTASNHLHVSTNEGHSWETISPDLTRNDASKLGPSGGPITKDNTSVEYYCTIFAAAESPRVKDLLWVGSDDGLVHVSKDGGTNWDNVTPNWPDWMMVNCIEPDPFNDGGCYVAGTRYKLGDFKPYLYKTSDYGKTWTKITSGIPDEHFTRAIRADQEMPGLLYAGTETGMYFSGNNGSSWDPLQLNLPIVPITDLAIKENNLIAATQGRSVWLIDDLNPIREVAKGMHKKDLHLFQPKMTYRTEGGSPAKPPKYAGENHPAGVMVYFYIDELKDEDEEEISLRFSDDQDRDIKTFSTKAKEKANQLKVEAGSNRFVWNMRYADADKFEKMVLWWASTSGPKAIPGKYKVELCKGENCREQEFEIVKDPRSPSTDKDYQEQFDFMLEVRDKISDAHKAIQDIKDIRSQVSDFSDRLPEDSTYQDIRDVITQMDSVITEVEEALYQTKNRSNQDPLNFPIRLTNKLGHLNSLTGIGDYPPTKQAVELKDELSKEIDDWLSIFENAMNKELPALNEKIRANNIDFFRRKDKEKDKA